MNAVGVMLCDCGGQLRKRLDFARLQRELSKEESVASVAVCSDLCAAGKCVAAIRSATSGGVKRLVVAAECPAYAITLPGYTDEQFAAEVGDKPRVIVFACENSAFPAAEAAGATGLGCGSSVRLIRVPCAGDVSPRRVLAALEKGAQKIVVMGCHPESCLYLSGSCRASGRMERLQGMLEKAGVDKSRVSFVGMAPVELVKFIEYVKES